MTSSALLFDFFGTLVEYQPNRSSLGYPETHELARAYGFGRDHEAFVGVWDAASQRLERTARRTLREFSMADAARAFAGDAGLRLTSEQLGDLAASFVDESARHIRPVAGVSAMIERLARSWSIAVVSNTHDPGIVPDLLDGMGIRHIVSGITLSVEHGWLKPHESIYRAALDDLRCAARRAVFVGDSFEADYVGPVRAGMRAFLIDPDRRHPVSDDDRLLEIGDLERALAACASVRAARSDLDDSHIGIERREQMP